MADLLRTVIGAGAPPSLARFPMTPEEVAEAYENEDFDPDEPDGEDEEAEDKEKAVAGSGS